MHDPNLATCPRCGAAFAHDDLAPVCLRCALSDTRREEAGGQPGSSSRSERSRRKLPRVWILVVLAAFFSMISSARVRRPLPSPKRSIVRDSGIELHSQAKLAEAITEFRRAIRIKPRDADAHYIFAVALEGQKHFEESIAEYRAAIKLAPDHAGAHNNVGVLLAARGKLDEAIDHYRKAIRSKADVGEFHSNLGQALEARGKLAEAIAEYRNAVWFMPENAGAHLNLGNAFEAQGKLHEAIAELLKARDSAPPGSEIARLIESALNAASDQKGSRSGGGQKSMRIDKNRSE